MDATRLPPTSRAFLERRLAVLWGRNVAEVRRRRGFSQQALARRSAVTQQTVSKVERGQVLPGDGLKLALAWALGVAPGELFAWPSDLDDLVTRATRARGRRRGP
ncbi:MAG: Helix-turn-helix domain [Acidimicrobiales bacterium]|nr:Helix-turn-helix domain [Acidimicrobiales bacterium]